MGVTNQQWKTAYNKLKAETDSAIASKDREITRLMRHKSDAVISLKTEMELVRDLWWFIENVTDETPDRTDRFFSLRERVREDR